jgi:hypothetical protein
MPTELPQLVAELEKKVADLSHQVRFLKGKLDSLEPRERSTAANASVSEQVLSLTKSLFGDKVQVVEKDDPEIPGECYAVLYVKTTLSDEEIAQKEDEWHKLVRAIACGMHRYFRISVDAR